MAGEQSPNDASQPGFLRIRADSALANYAYRSPHYLLGSILHDPTLSYAAISRQMRACGLLFDDPSADRISQIHPQLEQRAGGRPQNSYFSFQHKNVLVIQRLARGLEDGGSYNTGRIGIRFDGEDLTRVEEHGWIFATNGKAFAAVKFLDGGHTWDAAKTEALPANYTGNGDTGRILLHAGDIATQSFVQFRASVAANPLVVTSDTLDYRFGATEERIVVHKYELASRREFVQPLINGKALDLRPSASNPLRTFDSPFLTMEHGSDKAVIHCPGHADGVLDFQRRK